MALPNPKSALPASLEMNLASERKMGEAEKLRLRLPDQVPVTSLSLSHIDVSAMDGFEEFYLMLRRQERSLKRYQVMTALLHALREDPQVQAAAVLRIK